LPIPTAAGFFSQTFVPSNVIVVDDYRCSADNILASEGLFRVGSAADVLIFAGDLVMAAACYVPLRRAQAFACSLLLRIAQAFIVAMNTLTLLAVPTILGDAAGTRPGLGRDSAISWSAGGPECRGAAARSCRWSRGTRSCRRPRGTRARAAGDV
jgi:hypothetical protein